MTIQSWQSIIDLIRNGESVSAEVANRAIDQLRKRTDHLKARQDSQDLAQAIYIADAPLANGVSTGHAVYFDALSEKFSSAYADIEFKDGAIQPTASSSVVGVVIYKDTANSGVIVVNGWINPDNYDDFDCDQIPMLSNMLTNSSHRGILYLASGAVNAGKLVNKPGLLNIPVCNLVSSQHLLIRPPVTSTLNTQGLKLQLSNEIAGYGLCLRKGNGNTAGVFATKPAVGASVKVYLSAVGTSHPNDEEAVYFTGTVARYSDLLGNDPRRIHLTDLQPTKKLVEALKVAEGNYASVFTPATNKVIKIKVVETSDVYTVSESQYPCYIAPVTYDATVQGWTINTDVIDNTKVGWLPATNSVFNNAIKPNGAKFGYNVSKDPILQQLFPEGVVTAYLVMKDGVALSNNVVEINESGIWWKDSILQVPWHTVGQFSIIPEVKIDLTEWDADEANSIIMPSELHLAYVKLVTGGAKVVTSLDTPDDSPIIITDPFGNSASAGPLTIKAGFDITEATAAESGSLVVKSFSGFKTNRGRVVERVRAGANIEVVSSFPEGQGELTIGVTGLDGRLEGQPDILAVDDVLVERDSVYNIFYSVFPPAKASSILGKIDIPTYLVDGSYRVELDMTFLALHATGNSSLPALSLTWTALPGFLPNGTIKKDISESSESSTAQQVLPHPDPVASRQCTKKSVVLVENVARGSSVFFKLARGGDSYSSKLGLISINYRFVKS